ncbi:RHS repeat protein, partial [Chromobacterium alticapitis]
MVAVVTSAGLGVQNGSLASLGGQGQLGEAAFGRGGERVYVNAGNGNLVLQRRDDFL